MATPSQLADAEAWFAQYQTATAELDARTVAAIAVAYAEVQDWYDPGVTLAAAGTAAATAAAARQMHASLATEFMATFLEIFLGERPTLPRNVIPYPRAADPFDVYSRPVFAYRDAFARGATPEEATEQAQELAQVISLTDAIMARRDASQRTLNLTPEVKHYRRVIRPERSKTGTCGLCIAAATRVYTLRELMPIHSRCKCEVLPIIGSDDIGERFNMEDLEALYAATPGTKREELSRTRYRVASDGELGPLLVPRTRKRRASGETAEPVVFSDADRARKELDALLPVLASLEERAAAGESVAGPLAYQRSRIAKLQAVAA